MYCLFSAARGSRGTRQLKDFMGEAGDRGNRQRRSTGDELSDGREAVMSDNSDNEDAARRQPATRSPRQRGRGRLSSSSRGWYGEVRQQHEDSISDDAERPRYSNVRGRGFRNDRGYQRPGYRPRVNEGREGLRDIEYHGDTNRGPGRQSIGYRQKYDERQTADVRSNQPREDWNEEVDVSRSKPVELHRDHVRGTTVQAAEDNMSESRHAYRDHRVSDNIRPERQEDSKQMPTEPARRIHPTRTISNRYHQIADNIPNKERSSQIGGIVDAMNKISVRTTAGDDKQRSVAPKSAVIVSGMHC